MIDFSELEKSLDPLYNLQNETQELIIELRKTRDGISEFKTFSYKLDTMVDRQDRNERKIVSMLNRLDKLFEVEKSFEVGNLNENRKQIKEANKKDEVATS